MKTCREATRLHSEQMERPLSLNERAHLKFHGMLCASCRRFGEHMLDLRHIARQFAKGVDSQEEDANSR